MKRTFLLLWLLLTTVLAGCRAGGGANSQEITVFAASSLTDAFTELAAAFQAANDDVQVVFNFAGSSQLATQLREGALADVFAPANAAQMEAVIADGRITAGSEAVFAANQLTIVVPGANPAGIADLADLARPGVQLILAAPGVPVRQYSDAVIAAQPADLQTAIYANLVSEEANVRQVLAKVALGEADAGIVYTSDVNPDMTGRVRQIDIPAEQNVVAVYPIAPLADAPHAAAAARFVDFVLSDAGQAILARWGFGRPPAALPSPTSTAAATSVPTQTPAAPLRPTHMTFRTLT